jgi:hypothetical protein
MAGSNLTTYRSAAKMDAMRIETASYHQQETVLNSKMPKQLWMPNLNSLKQQDA